MKIVPSNSANVPKVCIQKFMIDCEHPHQAFMLDPRFDTRTLCVVDVTKNRLLSITDDYTINAYALILNHPIVAAHVVKTPTIWDKLKFWQKKEKVIPSVIVVAGVVLP